MCMCVCVCVCVCVRACVPACLRACYVTASLLNSDSTLGIMLPTGKKTRFADVWMRHIQNALALTSTFSEIPCIKC